MCIDSPIERHFTFTPATSRYVTDDESKIERYCNKLSEQGEVLMLLDEFPFSNKFAWVQGRFGVFLAIKFHLSEYDWRRTVERAVPFCAARMMSAASTRRSDELRRARVADLATSRFE